MREILDFGNASAGSGSGSDSGSDSGAGAGLDRWRIVNDGVMGGRSTSRVERTGDGTLRFAGVVSLENQGGFASTRAPVGPLDLAAFRGLAIRVRGDGRRYQLRLRMSPPRDRVAYKAEFTTGSGEWAELRLPFDDFRPTFRGRRPPDAPPLDPGDVAELGFLIADGRPGPFELEVEWVRAYGSDE